GDVDDSGDSGSEGLAIGGLRGQCQRAHGPAVEGPVDGDDERAAPSPGAAGHLERRLVRFGAGVREEHGGSVGQVEDLVQLLGRPIWAGEVKKFEMWPSVLACSAIAAVQAGWAWPTALTAMPASRSRYFLPDASQT